MKIKLFFFTLVLGINAIYAQLRVNTLSKVTEINTYSNTSMDNIVVNDPVRGGTFNLYTGSDAPDNGMIFSDGIGRKWLRQTSKENNIITLLWYGARADYATDQRSNLLSALSYAKKHPAFRTIYLPYDSVTPHVGYYMSDSILIDFPISIIGDGSYKEPKTRILFNKHKTGFVIKFPNGKAGFSTNFENLIVEGSYDFYRNLSKHAFKSNTITYFKNITIPYFDGYGFYINACASPPSGDNNNFGNASFSRLDNCSVHFTTIGLFTDGCDANVIKAENCDFSQNVRWGIYGNAQLSIKVDQCHFAFNGSPAIAGANSVVLYKGGYWQAMPHHDGFFMDDPADTNFNKRPDISPRYWKRIGPMAAYPWDSTKRYNSGGPACIGNPNSWSEFTSCYAEGSQPNFVMNGRSKVDGGTIGTGVFGAQWVLFSGQNLVGVDLLMPYGDSAVSPHFVIGANAPDYSAVITVKQNPAITGAYYGISLLSSTAQVFNKMTVNNGNFTVDGLSTDKYQRYINNIGIHQTTSAAFEPMADNTFNLGSAILKWKDIYGTNLYGNGSNITGIKQSSVSNLISDLSAMKRSYASRSVIAPNTNIMAAAGDVIHLPASTLTTNRTIDITMLNTENDYLEILCNETKFAWSFVGQSVYLANRTTVITTIAAGFHQFRRINGKIIKLN